MHTVKRAIAIGYLRATLALSAPRLARRQQGSDVPGIARPADFTSRSAFLQRLLEELGVIVIDPDDVE